MTATRTAGRSLLDAARGGDEDAFASLVAPHERELQAHAYRMLGSVHDAEDALQDALLRAWRGLPRFDGRTGSAGTGSSLRGWLYKIATNTCLDTIGRRQRRGLPMDLLPAAEVGEMPGRPLVESAWIEPFPDVMLEPAAPPDARYEQRESVELAFVAALQHLPASQRAVLILREVLGFSAKEVSELLDTSVPAVNSALQRARKTIDERMPDESQQQTLRALGDDGVRDIVERYMDAMARGDVDAVVAMLAQDAAWSMPPLGTWYRGHEALRAFLAMGPLSGRFRWTHVAASANSQPAIGSYTWREDEGCYRPFALDVLTLRGGQIAEITSFISRSADVPATGGFEDYPSEPIEEWRVADFARFGLARRGYESYARSLRSNLRKEPHALQQAQSDRGAHGVPRPHDVRILQARPGTAEREALAEDAPGGDRGGRRRPRRGPGRGRRARRSGRWLRSRPRARPRRSLRGFGGRASRARDQRRALGPREDLTRRGDVSHVAASPRLPCQADRA